MYIILYSDTIYSCDSWNGLLFPLVDPNDFSEILNVFKQKLSGNETELKICSASIASNNTK